MKVIFFGLALTTVFAAASAYAESPFCYKLERIGVKARGPTLPGEKDMEADVRAAAASRGCKEFRGMGDYLFAQCPAVCTLDAPEPQTGDAPEFTGSVDGE